MSTTEDSKQRQVVKDYVINAGGPVRTDEIRLYCFKQGISCADTYLRMLARDGEIQRFWELTKDDFGNWKHKHKTKSWSSNEYYDEFVKPNLGLKYAA